MRSLRLTVLAWSAAAPLGFCNLSYASAADSYVPPAASSGLLKGIDFSKATPVDEAYRAEFKRCDDQNRFRHYTLPGWRKCSSDKNNVRTLLKLQHGAIYLSPSLGWISTDLGRLGTTQVRPTSAELGINGRGFARTPSETEKAFVSVSRSMPSTSRSS
jgi:hypothetical protein